MNRVGMSTSRGRGWSIQTVPDDIWRLIFEEVVLDIRNQPPFFTDAIKMALKISHICTHFRGLTIHQPELWNRIPIAVAIDDKRASLLGENLLILALDRVSRFQIPLIVDLRVDHWSVHILNAHRPASTSVLPFVQYLGHADAIFSSKEHTVTSTEVCDQYLDLVQMLCAQTSPPAYFPQLGIFKNIISQLSKHSIKLKTLALVRQEGMIVSWGWFGLSSNQLTDIEIGGPITFQTLVAILHSTKQLLTCTLQELWDHEDEDEAHNNPSSLSFIPLLSLKELRIRGSRPIPYKSVSQVLLCLVAPSLERLFVSEGEWSCLHLMSFVNKSQFKLRSLSFEGVSLSSHEMVGFLELLPSLESLSFDIFFEMADNIFFSDKMMAWNPMDSTFQLCPQVRILNIFYTCMDSHPQSDTPISDMVERRLRGIG